MLGPVTVFLVAIACLLAAAAAVRPLSLRTGVPEAVWLIALGVVMRASGLVSAATIAALAPFFAAIALIIVLFEAGRDMVFGAGGEQVGRARKLAIVGAALVVPVVALFSQALSGLALLPTWSWTHALMLAALVLCSAPEVFAPTLLSRAHPGVVATLERESALTGALAIAATAVCIDLLSLKVPDGKAYAAIAAGFGLGLAFGAFAGLLWITAIRRIGPVRGVYPYTLAAILALYVVTDSLGGLGSLAMLVFGAVVANAGPLVAVLFRPRGAAVEAADEDFRAALDDHSRTVEITRVLLFTFIGLGLGPPWGLVAMGIVLGLILVVLRLLAARLVLRKLEERDFSALALGWPRGMVVAGLAALPHAAAVPGTESLTTLVFSAVATTCVAFAVAASHGGSSGAVAADGTSGHVLKDMFVGTPPRPVAARPEPAAQPTVEELLAPDRLEVPLPGTMTASRTLIAAPAEPVLAGPGAFSVRTEVAAAPEPASRTLIAAPAEPVLAGSGAFSVRTEEVAAPAPATRTLIAAPAEPVLAGSGAFSVRTEVAAAPAATRTLIAAPVEPVLAGSGAFSVRTEVAAPAASGLAIAAEVATPASPTRTEFVAPAGPMPTRRGEKTVLRSSGPGAPELIRHVFVRAADAVPPDLMPESVAGPRAGEAVPVAAVSTPPVVGGPVAPVFEPSATASSPEVGVGEPIAAERSAEAPLLDFLTDALLKGNSGAGLPTLSEWAGAVKPDPGAKEG